jgi:predicted nucleic acid-binding protein
MIVADTDVLIDYLRNGGAADRVAGELRRGLATTVISAFELWAGSVGSKKRERAVEKVLDALEILPLDTPGAREAASLRYDLRKQGRTMCMADALIAGICIAKQATLLTRNNRHFVDIPGLSLGQLE